MCKIKSRLRGLFPRRKTKPPSGDLLRRMSRAAENILGNERLTSDLDDTAAKILTNWGVAWAERIAQSTADLEDTQAEEVISPRLRATRRLMRLVNRWAPHQGDMDAEGSATTLAKIIDQASVIYGKNFDPPDDSQRNAFLQSLDLTAHPSQLVEKLHSFIEEHVH